jgi:hypothetical protein
MSSKNEKLFWTKDQVSVSSYNTLAEREPSAGKAT